jgi:hypothetical protein
MNIVENPFQPGAGTQPPALVGRSAILEDASNALARVKNGLTAKSIFLVGLRGVGKTVLLRKILSLAEYQGYKASMIEVDENKGFIPLLIRNLRQVLLQLDAENSISSKVKKGLRVLKSFIKSVEFKVGSIGIQLDIESEKGLADSGILDADLAEVFIAIAEAAKEKETALAIIIDELQYIKEEELSALIMAIHKVAQAALPLIVIGAGLPQLVGKAGKAKSYAERLFTYPELGPLEIEDAKRALQEPVTQKGISFTAEALEEIINVTGAYPYFLQEWGYQAWNLAQGPIIDLEVIRKVTPQAIDQLDQNFFRVRYDRLTPREKEYLRALADLEVASQRSGTVAGKLMLSVSQAAPRRQSLIKKGMIYSPRHGGTAFSVPLFGDFMKRVMP